MKIKNLVEEAQLNSITYLTKGQIPKKLDNKIGAIHKFHKIYEKPIYQKAHQASLQTDSG
jgi:hypothetical protein